MSDPCSPDDPQRCQAVTPHGQCIYLSESGSDRCAFHSSVQPGKFERDEELNRYLIDNQRLKASYERQKSDAAYLDLKQEILLLQAILERRLNAMQNDADVIAGIGAVTQLVKQLESMKVALLKMQQSLGLVLNKDSLKQLAKQMAIIIDEELADIPNKDDILERLVTRIGEAISSAGEKTQPIDSD